ncbi:hypothetical protein BB560_001846 [Smittium megazygosporum]|uniref:GST N-terminal domain-containing protein n=1 Tax=Smittium megazygosporum TaxID=133381 RepID=A0A2T9ZGF3_9FUNG|nr:hypothetical protein BB560_001846 [Smittium megazygosporum]
MVGKTKYIVEYFQADALAWTARAILSLAGVEYENKFPEWPAHSPKTPFGRMPVLTEISPDGSKFVLAESCAIELYLAEKYGFLPKDIKEKATAMQYYFQFVDIFETFGNHTFYYKTETSRERFLDRVKTFIERHEPILENSKSGHYCGDSLTLPDILLYFLHKSVIELDDQSLNLFATQQTPAISKLVAMVGEYPGIKKAFL